MRALANLILFSLLFLILQKVQAGETPNIYQYVQAGMFSPVVKNMPNRIYVPNGLSNDVSVIDPLTYTVIQTMKTGEGPQHVVPSYDLQTLWVLNNKSNTITPIDPTNNQLGASIKIDDPYNMYFTQDGKFAIVVSESRQELIKLAPKLLEMEIIPIAQLPLYNQDLDNNPPKEWVEFKNKITSVDGFLFATPEYNRSIPGVLKNAVDVASRPYGKSAWEGKPAAVVSVSPSAIGGFGANQHLRQCFVFLNVPCMQQPELYIGNVTKLLDEEGNIKNEDTIKLLQKFIDTFAEWVHINSSKK